MADLRTRELAADHLGKSGRLSLKQDIFGVYATDNPQNRSLKAQLGRIRDRPFVRVALVTIAGSATGNLQRDLDNASQVYRNECGAWVYCVGSITVTDASLLVLNQDDCLLTFHSVSDEEDTLFDLGRNLGADVVGYYVNGSNLPLAGCAAHPAGRRGFWVNQSTAGQWDFAHELTHVVGTNSHIEPDDTDNLMRGSGPSANPPELTDA